MDLLIRFKGDSLTGFTNLFRLNISLATLHIGSKKVFNDENVNNEILMGVEGLVDSQKRFTNLHERFENNDIDSFQRQKFLICWKKDELDNPSEELPKDFEFQLEFEAEAEKCQNEWKDKWDLDWAKNDSLRLQVLELLKHNNKDFLLGKTMLFGDPTLMDIQNLTLRKHK